MARLTNYQMAYLLSVSTHRAKYPVVDWVENNVKKDNKDNWNGWLGYGALDRVRVVCGFTCFYYFLDENLKVESVLEGPLAGEGDPSKKDIDFLQAIDPGYYSSLRDICTDLPRVFDRPHHCIIQVEYTTKDCRCGRNGIVNHYSGHDWEFYCGRGSSCMP